VTAQKLLLSLALVPYVSLALVDGWMHEKDRQVPRVEQWFHAAIFLFIGSFLVAVFLGHNMLAVAALICGIPCLAIDEIKFHGELPAKERRIHFLADGALAVFILIWLITAFT